MAIVETSAKVIEIIRRTPSVISVRVKPELTEPFKAGQWLMVILGSEKGLSKPLSISNSPTEAGYLELTKRITVSEFSKAFCALKPGDTLRIKYPQGRFVFEADVSKIAFVSGGIGITPIRSICRDIADRALGTDVVLVYGNNSIDEIAFRDDLEAMRAHSDRFKVVHVLREAPVGWAGPTGFVSEELLRQQIPDFVQRRFYLCGPPPMVEALKKILVQQLGVPVEHIVTEGFAGYN